MPHHLGGLIHIVFVLQWSYILIFISVKHLVSLIARSIKNEPVVSLWRGEKGTDRCILPGDPTHSGLLGCSGNDFKAVMEESYEY